MKYRIRASFLSLAIIAVLVFSAVRPINAYADDGLPSGETPTEVTSTSGNPDEPTGDAGLPEEAPPTEEPILDLQPTGEATPTPEAIATEPAAPDSQPTEEATPVPEEGIPTEEPTADSSPAETASEEETVILSSVPENTDVTVLDANGEVQSLATQAAADVIATSDPIWCPGSQAPTPGQNGCTQTFDSFDALLTFLSGDANYQGAGTIYVQQGAYQGNDPNNVVDFNSPNYDLSNINNSDLTITGGWNTTTNTIDSANPTVFTEYSILIGSGSNPWGGSLTINNISIVFEGSPDWGADTNGLTLYADEDISLSNVSVTAASNKGAELHAGRNVNIRNSNFQQNGMGGAVIQAGGDVNVASSSFGNPYTDRDRWQKDGLDIESAGSVSLFEVIAMNNREVGSNINAAGRVTIGSSIFSGSKRMWDENGETFFLGYGLQVITPDSIELDDVTANDNFLWGAKLDSGGDIAIRNSVFNANTTENPGFIDDTGLFITSKGDVALDNVTASDNRLYGAQIDATGSVSINNSTFNNNRGAVTIGGVTEMHGHGLQVDSLSDIFINNTSAVGNMIFGGQLQAAGSVAISNSTFSDTIPDDPSIASGTGLEIVSSGNTSLLNVILDNNQSVGADIRSGADTYLDLVTATDNGLDGVSVQTSCAHLSGGLYSGNGRYGLNLNSSALDEASPAIFFNNAAGDIFPANPVTCAPAINSGPVTADQNAGSLNTLMSFTSASTVSDTNVSLAGYLAGTTTWRNSYGIFIGKYYYVETRDGLQVLALNPVSEPVAMAAP